MAVAGLVEEAMVRKIHVPGRKKVVCDFGVAYYCFKIIKPSWCPRLCIEIN